jgi:sugar/nucleoside kinase (ribokinase family)
MADVVVAGHVCVDLIPTLPRLADGFSYAPGALLEVGPATVSTGGCAPNTGLALHRLGASVRLVGLVGDDPFGSIVRRRLAGEGLDGGIRAVPGEATSYTVVLSPPEEDRMFLHFPGANDSFGRDAVTAGALQGARIFHFGYPPLMRRMHEDGGENLAALLARARAAGLATSLDMAYPDPSTSAGKADWPRILARVLPETDLFVPSLDELSVMLGSANRSASLDDLPRLGEDLIRMGAAVVGIKCGPRGLYLRTADEDRLRHVAVLEAATWAGWELWSPAFEVEVLGTAGAGDATAAGLLHALNLGAPPEEAVTAAVAAGAMSVEAPDATGGIRSWDEARRRISAGWKRKAGPPGEGWSPHGETGLWGRR